MHHSLSLASLQRCLTQHQADGLIDLMKRCALDWTSSNKNNIPARSYLTLLQPQPHRLAHPALDPIAHHCFANSAPGDKTKSTAIQAIGQSGKYQRAMGKSPSLAMNTLEIGTGA